MIDSKNISHQVKELYKFEIKNIEELKLSTNQVFKINATDGRIYALKTYQRRSDDIEWEIDLVKHLLKDRINVNQPVSSTDGFIASITSGEKILPCVLYRWVPGEKPVESIEFYRKLGQLAGKMHKSADNFTTKHLRKSYDLDFLIDEQLVKIKDILKKMDRYDEIEKLFSNYKDLLRNTELDYGVCHMDLKPDNVHTHNDVLTVFDLDSATTSWRAIEPYRVLQSSEEYFNSWLVGYREVRDFSKADENAVRIFTIVGDLRDKVWHLGRAESSVGDPNISYEEFQNIVNAWLRLGKRHQNLFSKSSL